MSGSTLVEDVPVLSYCMVLFADFSVDVPFNNLLIHLKMA
jgi:hypothetical protein